MTLVRSLLSGELSRMPRVEGGDPLLAKRRDCVQWPAQSAAFRQVLVWLDLSIAYGNVQKSDLTWFSELIRA